MSRSGYSDDLDQRDLAMYRGQVANAIRGKRGQAFLRELADALDAMPVKELIAGELIDDDGQCCAIGAVCQKRGIDVSGIDYDEPSSVGNAVGIARQLAAEIEYENDERDWRYRDGEWVQETPAERWQRMRKWVASKIKD